MKRIIHYLSMIVILITIAFNQNDLAMVLIAVLLFFELKADIENYKI